MDQVKKIMAGAQENVFWIVSGLTIVLGIVGYWVSRSSMDKTFTDQSTKIDGQYSALNTISGEVSKHPNSKSHEQMDKIINKLVDDVEAAWVKQYDRQVKLLQWPRDAFNDKFLAKVEKYRPIELKLEYPLEKQPLTTADLTIYDKYFDEQFPKLAEIIGCKWVGKRPATGAGGMGMMGGMSGAGGGYGTEASSGGPEGGYGGMMGGGMMGGGMMGGGMGGAGNMFGTFGPDGRLIKPDLVVWPEPVQTAVMADVQTWRTKLPTTHDILYTQENIWILQGLLNIIAKANYGAVANFQCTVKRIEFLRIGRSAVTRAGMIDRVMPTANAGAMGMGAEGAAEGEGMAGSGDMMAGMESGESLGASAEEPASDAEGDGGMYGGAVASPDPANGRYVDAAFKPVTGDDLRTKMKSEQPEDAYFTVAKRVPVRMRFVVDQRRLQALLAECGNADLMFEIRQVRIGDTQPAPAGGSGGMGMGSMSGMMAGMAGAMGGGSEGGYGDQMSGGMGGMMGGMGGMMGGGGPGGGGNAPVITMPMKGWDLPVEIYGMVYLFNPPDKDKLGLNKVTAETEVTDKVEVSADEVPAAGAPDAATQPADAATGAAAPAAGAPATPAAGAPATPAVPGGQVPAQPGAAPAGATPAPAGAGAPAPGAAPGVPGAGTPAGAGVAPAQ